LFRVTNALPIILEQLLLV